MNVQSTEKYYKSVFYPKLWGHARKQNSMEWENAAENGSFAVPSMHLEWKEKRKEGTWNPLVVD